MRGFPPRGPDRKSPAQRHNRPKISAGSECGRQGRGGGRAAGAAVSQLRRGARPLTDPPCRRFSLGLPGRASPRRAWRCPAEPGPPLSPAPQLPAPDGDGPAASEVAVLRRAPPPRPRGGAEGAGATGERRQEPLSLERQGPRRRGGLPLRGDRRAHDAELRPGPVRRRPTRGPAAARRRTAPSFLHPRRGGHAAGAAGSGCGAGVRSAGAGRGADDRDDDRHHQYLQRPHRPGPALGFCSRAGPSDRGVAHAAARCRGSVRLRPPRTGRQAPSRHSTSRRRPWSSPL